ncbi:Peroxisomal membrane protein 11C [Frankliniella fusca]|uniref:Peroxisomal membrane protein 11C n=1 Tax=Frankliniella fusca TaxID=407009 RepID=A0AAE1LI62_9NEOP|nr:Peroxisomal membrane protein 11C [Frankliniella fusca]
MSVTDSTLLDRLDEYLDTYSGRDKLLKALCYSLKFATRFYESPKTVHDLKLVSSEISNCRTILRFLDYVPVFKYVLTYKFGKNEKDKYLKLIGRISCILDVIFYPLEQVAWLAERKIIKVNPEPWDNASTVCWVVSLYLGLMKALRSLSLLEQHKKCLKTTDADVRLPMERVLIQQRGLLLLAIRTSCDLVYAIHYLPEGFLWSSKLETWQVGALGMVSAGIGIFQSLSSWTKVPSS